MPVVSKNTNELKTPRAGTFWDDFAGGAHGWPDGWWGTLRTGNGPGAVIDDATLTSPKHDKKFMLRKESCNPAFSTLVLDRAQTLTLPSVR